MPDLNGSDSSLTQIQYDHMTRWKDGTYTNDWVGVPAPQAAVDPDGLDRAALEACVGGAFFPGIEAGGLDASSRPIVTSSNYLEAFRLNHAVVPPGGISHTMALPWQADFMACADNWWPVPRPNDVTPQGTSTSVKWARTLSGYGDMVDKWYVLGFVVKQGAEHVEVDRCDTATITLLTPHLNFVDVPQGPMGTVREVPLAITFEVISPAAAVTLDYAPGGAPTHLQLIAANASETVGPTAANTVATARLWIIFRTGTVRAGDTAANRDRARGREWADLDGHDHGEHGGAQDRGDRAGARPFGKHERRPRRRAGQAPVPAESGKHLRRRHARRRWRGHRPLQPGRSGAAERPAAGQ